MSDYHRRRVDDEYRLAVRQVFGFCLLVVLVCGIGVVAVL